MSNIKILDVKADILEDNMKTGEEIRNEMKRRGTFLLNLMGSPGSGKTTTLEATIKGLKDKFSVGVMEADVDSDVDARRIEKAGARAIQLHTGGSCHMDAEMTRQGIDGFDTEGLDLLVIENVGNLVCPAEFDVGAARRVCILSVPEGDDKPLKYPLMFETADLVLVNKMDTISFFDFDMDKFRKNVHSRKEDTRIIPFSAKSGEGLEEWLSWLTDEIEIWKR